MNLMVYNKFASAMLTLRQAVRSFMAQDASVEMSNQFIEPSSGQFDIYKWNSQLNQLFTKVIVQGNLPFSVVASNPFFQEFLSLISFNLFRMDSAYKITHNHLPNLFNQLMNDLRQFVSMPRDAVADGSNVWTIAEDGGGCISNKSIHCITISNSQRDFLVRFLDLSQHRYTAKLLLKIIIEALKQVGVNLDAPNCGVSAIASDNPSSMIALKREVHHTTNGRVQAINCILHVLSNLSKDFIKSSPMFILVLKQANAIIHGVSRPFFTWGYAIEQEQKKRKIASLSLFSPTRFYGCSTTLLSILENLGVLRELLTDPAVSGNYELTDLNKGIANLIGDEDFEANAKFLIKLLKPIADCIGYLEHRASNLSHIPQCFLYIDRALRKIQPLMQKNEYSSIKTACFQAVKLRFQSLWDTSRCYRLALELDPRCFFWY